jgi:serine/threonine protein phosphatase PrpC
VGTTNRGRKTITTTRNTRASTVGKVAGKKTVSGGVKKTANGGSRKPATGGGRKPVSGGGRARKRSRSRSRKVARTAAPPKKAVQKTGGEFKIQTAMRKQKDESKESPEYTQLRTNKPPVCYYAKQGPRDYMEDTYQIMHFDIGGKPGTFYGVFDGHGGKDVSYECVHMSRGIFPYLIENIKRARSKNITQVIKTSFIQYDKILFKKNLNAGSTAVVVLFYDNQMWLVNLGDSRGMIFTKGGLIAVSDDHKPQKPTEKTRIYRAGHFVNPFRIFNQRPEGKRFTIGDVYKDADKREQFIYLHGKWEPIGRDQMTQIEEMTKDAKEDTTRVSNSLALSRALGDFYLKTDHQER